ncbi:hypothetical protein F5879DRAFT_995800 [Lentinula edodes]|nr:hypothetical protein F5879DRAFT_995800 [Lentinula edodes]
MSSSPSKAPSAAGPSRSSLPRSPSEAEVEQDQLAFTIESPSIPQIQLFENVFNTGKSLAAYCQDDPLWPTLAAVALSCSNCTKHPETCKVPEGSPRSSLLYSRSPGTNGVTAVLLITSLLSHSSSALRHLVALARLHGVHDLNMNMLDKQDSRAIDRSELRHFQEAQEQETLLAAKRKCVNASPPPKVRPKKRRLTKVVEERRVEEPVVEEVPRLVRLVIPPLLFQVQLRRVPSVRLWPFPWSLLMRLGGLPTLWISKLVPKRRHLPVPWDRIKASREDPAVPKMSPVVCPPLVPRILSQHPYRVENERLAARVRLLESQLASSRQENATLTSALRDTSVSLEARQGELDQLRESVSSAAQQQELYDRLLDQVETLKRALPGPPNESLVDRFQGLEEDLRLAHESWAKYLSCFESSNRRNEELKTSLVQQQSLVDESNALAVQQRKKIEALQEEVYCFRDREILRKKVVIITRRSLLCRRGREGEGGVTAAVLLFLPDPLSPTPIASAASPPSLPPPFGSVATLVIDMTADEDDEDIYESPGSIEHRNYSEGNPGEDDPMEDGPVVP